MPQHDTNAILLESGTNEVEILEFRLGKQSFGVNVAKVLQLMAFDEDSFSSVPDASEAVLGLLRWRGENLPLFDLHTALKRLGERTEEVGDRPIIIVTEFNRVHASFIVSEVERIHRVDWEQISPLNQLMADGRSLITGTLHIDEREVLLVDFESLLAKFSEDIRLDRHAQNLGDVSEHELRTAKHIWNAEDSGLIRHQISDILTKVGYQNLRSFENGEDCWNALVESIENEQAPVDLIISDIEMPRLDGLTLCRRIKDHPQLQKNPRHLIYFSGIRTNASKS